MRCIHADDWKGLLFGWGGGKVSVIITIYLSIYFSPSHFLPSLKAATHGGQWRTQCASESGVVAAAVRRR